MIPTILKTDESCSCTYGRIARHGVTVAFAIIGALWMAGIVIFTLWRSNT